MIRTFDAARALGITPQALNRAAKNGSIPRHLWKWARQNGKLGRKIRLFHPDVQKFVHTRAGRPSADD